MTEFIFGMKLQDYFDILEERKVSKRGKKDGPLEVKSIRMLDKTTVLCALILYPGESLAWVFEPGFEQGKIDVFKTKFYAFKKALPT